MLYICEQRNECCLGHICHHAEPHKVVRLPILSEPCNKEVDVGTCPKHACVPVQVEEENAMTAVSS
jgi:hypothetical protein